MKAIFVILTLVLAIQAKADSSLPFSCSAVIEQMSSNDVNVQIGVAFRGSVIRAILQDGDDRAKLRCKKVPTDIPSIQSLECRGVWSSDESKASLSASLNTYVPFVVVQRSNTGFGGQKLDGLCVN